MKLRILPLLALLPALTARSQSVPTTINYQGRLTDNTPAQTPVNATANMQFEIWDLPSGGTAGTNRLWREPNVDNVAVPVAVNNGVFNYALGTTVAIPPTVFTGVSSTRYLQVILNPSASQEILTPRQLITATGYANLSQVTSTAPDSALSANAALLNRTPQSFTGANNFTAAGTAVTVTNTLAAGAVETGTVQRATGNLDFSTNGVSRLTIANNGLVGIGVPVPAESLDVSGNVRVTGKMSAGTDAGNAAIIKLGERYRDNGVAAWANVRADGLLYSSVGIATLTHTTGTYAFTTNFSFLANTRMAVVAVPEIDAPPTSAAAARLISVDALTGNTFTVYVTNGNYVLTDSDFMVIATGR